MADLEQIIRAFQAADTSPARQPAQGTGEPQNGKFSFTAGGNANTFSVSLSLSQRFYMTKQHRER